VRLTWTHRIFPNDARFDDYAIRPEVLANMAAMGFTGPTNAQVAMYALCQDDVGHHENATLMIKKNVVLQAGSGESKYLFTSWRCR
jgi:hypothetical protein